MSLDDMRDEFFNAGTATYAESKAALPANNELATALTTINEAFAKLDDDIAAMMPDAVLSALAFVKKHDDLEFSRIYHRMKKYGIAVDMKKRVKIFSKKEKFSKKPTHPTPSTLPRATEDLTLHQAYTNPTLLLKIKPIEADALVICDGETGEVQSVIESVAALILVECLNGGLAYSSLAKTWHGFDGTHWQPMTSDAVVDKTLIELIYQGTQSVGFKNCYRANIKSLIADSGFLPLPAANHSLLPFKNGLLCCQTKTLHTTTAANAQTWCLPYSYTPSAQCPTIQRFLLTAVDGDAETVEFLRAWLAALLHGRADLQIFLHLMGSGGTGKGTLMRLAVALVGRHNAASTTLPAMENNQFETANFYQKRLVMITDSDKYGGSINTLKAMTGQDQLRLERKHQQQSGGFQYEGMVVIASNENLAFTDHTSGLERRRRTVSFDRRVTDAEKQAWNDQGGEAAVLHKEMPGLVNWLLELSQDDISAAIRKPPQRTQDANFEAMQAGNPIAAWLIENCIPDCKAWSQIGECIEIREQGEETKYQDADIHLYPNYLQWAQRYKRVALALVRFRETAIDAVKTFGFDASAKRRNSGQGISGIRLKKDWEEPLNYWKPE
ncbi:MAG: phage/plasmid primase, P4 family [Methylobacter sp.]|nr:phage/plasmid primase, P4 family [Methylobacter sp.]MDP2097048.1 phage/plasmid primase, P4 family [Methylobacter sp.]MDP2429470.1 phage/plasmid primase, P4 family [Methylobacter sp.]MDP3055980.1 phage/plasmid primase, P4 family [Methylobacter sp.]MDP3361836.1 phage/plasmid primase, P4 family [Methylobacter sp.]